MSEVRPYIICDDIAVNNLVLSKLIEMHDTTAMVLQTTSGADCLETYMAAISSRYQIKGIYLDYMMPMMDGVQVAIALRERAGKVVGGPNYGGPLHMVTACPADEVEVPEGLFDSIMHKPLTAKDVAESIGGEYDG